MTERIGTREAAGAVFRAREVIPMGNDYSATMGTDLLASGMDGMVVMDKEMPGNAETEALFKKLDELEERKKNPSVHTLVIDPRFVERIKSGSQWSLLDLGKNDEITIYDSLDFVLPEGKIVGRALQCIGIYEILLTASPIDFLLFYPRDTMEIKYPPFGDREYLAKSTGFDSFEDMQIFYRNVEEGVYNLIQWQWFTDEMGRL